MSSPTQKPRPPWSAPNGVYETYAANCHCGAHRYTVKISPPLHASASASAEAYQVISCNCSICSRNGYLLVYPAAADVTWQRGGEGEKGEEGEGEGVREVYEMGSRSKPHWFCRRCGSSLGIDIRRMGDFGGGGEKMAMNVRMFKDIDLDTLEYKKVNGKAMLTPRYEL
ncbi:hypothetical protein LTR66_013211 [Elasticomyces elasticus]|nr:hypothetical protein LTR66_013211 [Elasticomyces elasticus]